MKACFGCDLHIWDEGDVGNVVADLLKVDGELTLDFVVVGLGVIDRGVVHLVDSEDHLLVTNSLGEKSVLSGLSVLKETSLETIDIGIDHMHGGISL